MPPVFGPLVAVVGALVVAGERHRGHRDAVRERVRRDLAANQPLFDDYRAARRAEDRLVAHHLLDRLDRCFRRIADESALAGGQPVRLHDCAALQRLGVVAGVRNVAERSIGRRRDAVALHQVFGEGLRRFDPCGRLRRPEGGDPFDGQPVGQPARQRVLRADDDEIDSQLLRCCHDAFDVRCLDVQVGSDRSGPRVAGSDEEIGETLGLS